MPLAIWQWQSSMSSKSCSNLCCIIDVLQSQMHKVLYLPLVAVEVCKLTPWGYMATVKKIISSMLLLWHSALIWKLRTENRGKCPRCYTLWVGSAVSSPALQNQEATDIWPLSCTLSLSLFYDHNIYSAELHSQLGLSQHPISQKCCGLWLPLPDTFWT